MTEVELEVAAGPPSIAERARGWAAPTVWSVWVVTTAIAASIVARHGRRFPYAGDFDVAEVVSGRKQFSLAYLWSPRQEHRFIVPRLVITPLTTLFDGDFRAVVWFNLLLLAGTAAIAIVATRRVRGYTAIGDAFFPLIMLSAFQSGLTWSFQVHFTSVAMASVGILLVMSRFGLDAPAGWLWGSIGLMVVLYGDAGPGLALLPFLLLWMVLSAVRLHRTSRGHARGLLAAVAVICVGLLLYFVGLKSGGAKSSSPSKILLKGLHILTSTGGARADDIWPISAILVVLVLGATALMLAIRWLRSRLDPDARSRAAALLCFGAAVATLAIAVGYGRGAAPWDAGLATQYAPLFTTVACWVYLAWLHARPPWSARAGIALLAVAALIYAVNLADMRSTFSDLDRQEAAFSRDVCRLDLDAAMLRNKYFVFASPSFAELHDAADSFRAMRRKGWPIYQCPG